VTSIASSVDFQRDFIETGGFGEIQGGDLTAVKASVGPAAAVLKFARRAGLMVVHTREGHEPSLRDCPTSKASPNSFTRMDANNYSCLQLTRQANAPNSRYSYVIGEIGPTGSRLLVRGSSKSVDSELVTFPDITLQQVCMILSIN